MSSVINPVPTNFPTGITVPSDGDGPGIKAADVVPAFQGILDRTGYVSARVQEAQDFAASMLLNFPLAMQTGFGTLTQALWNEAARAWIIVGNNGGVAFRRSVDGGASWGANEYTDAARYVVDAACKLSSGDVAGITSTGQILLYSHPASFSLSAITPFGVTPTAMRIYCTPTTGVYFAVGHVGGTIAAYTSTAPTTAWTTRTPAIGSGGLGTGMVRAAIRPSDELIVCVNAAGSNQVTVQTSTDQGATWTAQATINLATVTGLASSANTSISIQWDPIGSRFILAVSKNGGAGALTTDIYASAAGVSWTLLKSFSSAACFGVASVGLSPLAPRLVALFLMQPVGTSNLQTELAYSVDAGATWRWAGVNFSSTAPLTLVPAYSNAAQQLIALTTTKVATGLKAGVAGQVVT